MENRLEFKQDILFDKKHKFCKFRELKNGALMGEFNTNFKLVIEKQKGWNNNTKVYDESIIEYVGYLVPVKHTKVENGPN